MKNLEIFSEQENVALKVLNYIASFDGIIRDEEEIKFILNEGIKKFISKKNRKFLKVINSYPIKIRKDMNI